MHKNIRLYGKWMYERSDIADLIRLIEIGLLDVSVTEIVGQYPLEKWEEAFDKAANNARFAQIVSLTP